VTVALSLPLSAARALSLPPSAARALSLPLSAARALSLPLSAARALSLPLSAARAFALLALLAPLAALIAAPAHADPAAFDATPASGGAASQASTVGIGSIPPEVLAVAEAARGKALPERVGDISAALLARPYVSDPMGEGTAPDADPLARYDAFDCLTFAEEVLALAMAGDPAHAAEIRSSLRYGEGVPRDYVHRRHFMELQWIPGVVAEGWLRDTTREYGEVVTLDKEVTAATWRGWGARKNFAHRDEELPVGRMHLDVLGLDAARAAADRIRPGSVILTVRVDRPGVPLWVTHVSLVVPGPDGGTTMRHATKIGSGGTRDHGLGWYVDHLRTYRNWPVLGIAILEPVEQGPRAAVGRPLAP
jgi:hypothetical protein